MPRPPTAGRAAVGTGKEDDVGNLTMLGQFLLGVGVLLLGVAAIWFVSVYASRK